jgi:hypothetical protein
MKGSDCMKSRGISLLIMAVDLKMNGGSTCHPAEATRRSLTAAPWAKLSVARGKWAEVWVGAEQ